MYWNQVHEYLFCRRSLNKARAKMPLLFRGNDLPNASFLHVCIGNGSLIFYPDFELRKRTHSILVNLFGVHRRIRNSRRLSFSLQQILKRGDVFSRSKIIMPNSPFSWNSAVFVAFRMTSHCTVAPIKIVKKFESSWSSKIHWRKRQK